MSVSCRKECVCCLKGWTEEIEADGRRKADVRLGVGWEGWKSLVGGRMVMTAMR